MVVIDLASIAAAARSNSERWFPLVHDPDAATVPLFAHYTLGLDLVAAFYRKQGICEAPMGEAMRRVEIAIQIDLDDATADKFLDTVASVTGQEILDIIEGADEFGLDPPAVLVKAGWRPVLAVHPDQGALL